MSKDKAQEKYKDIIDLPYVKSVKHPHMTLLNRAAQFSPFAALTGYGDVIDETARLTDRKIELTEGEREELDRKLSSLLNRDPDPGSDKKTPGRNASGEITVTYFIQDLFKSGGRYEIHTGMIKKLDTVTRQLIFQDGTVVPFDDISDIETVTAQIQPGDPI